MYFRSDFEVVRGISGVIENEFHVLQYGSLWNHWKLEENGISAGSAGGPVAIRNVGLTLFMEGSIFTES